MLLMKNSFFKNIINIDNIALANLTLSNNNDKKENIPWYDSSKQTFKHLTLIYFKAICSKKLLTKNKNSQKMLFWLFPPKKYPQKNEEVLFDSLRLTIF